MCCMLYNGHREWLRHESICIKSKNQTIYYLSKSVWVDGIISINQKRWQIEECFRIMKSEFQARPVYLSRKDRITAHLVLERITRLYLKEK